MNCPNCDSIYVVNDMYGNHDKSSGNLIVVFGYVCDECNHEWKDVKAVEWRD